jgi:iron(III) transport system substrate-binding protein
MKTRKGVAWGVILGAWLVAMGLVVADGPPTNGTRVAWGASWPPAMQELIAQAQREGEMVVFYGTQRFTEQDMQTASQRFGEKYGIKVKVLQGPNLPHPPMVQKLLTESKAGVPSGIDAFTTSADLLYRLKAGGLLQDVDWLGLGVPKQFVMHQIWGVNTHDLYRTIVYNTKLVKKGEAPRRWTDLLNPKWKGKMVMPSFAHHWALIAAAMGSEEAAMDLARKLKEQQHVALVPSYTDPQTRVGGGEFLLGLAVNAGIAAGKRDLPIANAPMEKVGGFNWAGGVMKDAKHPAAATLYLHFIGGTPEGAKMAWEIFYQSRTSTEGTEMREVGGNGKGVIPHLDWHITEAPKIQQKFVPILGLR